MEHENRSVLRHAFFGQANCVTLDHGSNGTFLRVGKKNGDGWGWQTCKMSMPELGDIISVLDGKADQMSFFHSFKGKETKIWVNRDEKGAVFFKIEDHAKPLNGGEQVVMKVLIEEIVGQRLRENAENGKAGAENAPAA